MKICKYCGNETEEGKPCDYCNAPLGDAKKKPKEFRGNPVFYNGYIVWNAQDDFDSYLRYYFYLGERLVETIEFPRDFLYTIDGFDEGQSIMPFVWSLFELAQGNEEVLRIKEKNRRRPAVFEIRHVEEEKLSEDEARLVWLREYS